MFRTSKHRFFLLSIFLWSAQVLFGQFHINDLQCEYRTDPLGIDELNPRFSWRLFADESKKQSAYRILVASSKKALSEDKGDLWDSGITASPLSHNIIYQGKALKAFQSCYWKVKTWDENKRASAWSDVALFTMGPLGNLDWPAAWIGPPESFDKSRFFIYSKDLELTQRPQQAYMYVNALGYFELFVNGTKVSEDILSPSVSDYSRFTLFTTYDISPYLKEGHNSISIWSAHGWNRKLTWPEYFGVPEEAPLLRAFGRFSYPQGTVELVPTDGSWTCTYSNRQYTGSWKWGDFGGELVNLKEEEGFEQTDSSGPAKAETYPGYHIAAIAQRNLPTHLLDSLSPVENHELGNKSFLVDFGKHLTGWLRFEFNGEDSDSIIKIEYLDKLLDLDSIQDPIEKQVARHLGSVDSKQGYISYNQHDLIIPARKKREQFQNKFNYHAYRWIKVSGINMEDLLVTKALQLSEKNRQIAFFESSDPGLNKIWEAVVHTYRCLNYSGYVVDCPHRERLGYGGDSHSSWETALSIFDVSPLGNKWTLDWNVSQYPSGFWPHAVPHVPQHKDKFSPGWGGFGMFLPWQFYRYYGDTLNLSRAYPYIKKWMNYLESNTTDGILHKDSLLGETEFGAFHGDWVAPYYGMARDKRVDQTSTNFFNNCFYLYELDMAKKIAHVLGERKDAQYFSSLHAFSKSRIHKRFYNSSEKWYANGEQPYQAFPLLIDLVPDSLKQNMEEFLEYLILEKNKGHLNSGMLGTYFMLEYLMKAGRNDLIYTMVNQKTFPGWGHMIEQGATTLWEQWNGDNSQIHNCYLSIGKWFVQGLGGIQNEMEGPGKPHFIIRPEYLEELDYVNVSYDSRFGKILSNWKKSDGGITHHFEIPVNIKVSYVFPREDNTTITVNGSKVDAVNNEQISLEAGSYQIRISN